jgi:hypothetical protein
MRLSIKRPLLASAAVAVTVLAACASSPAVKNDMSFFVTSRNGGNGANLGGLEGADRLCQSLASAAGAGSRTWRAYLSATAAGGAPAVNARDRIGRGPWRNANGVVIANDVAQLHGTNNITKQTALTETGAVRQRSRRYAEPARHPDRLAAGRHRDRRKRRHDLRQLDQERRGRRDGRPPRPHRARRERAGQVVELVAPVARLRHRRAEGDRRRRAPLLLRGQLTVQRASSRANRLAAKRQIMRAASGPAGSL